MEGGWRPGYTEEEVGYNLSLVYGPEFSGSVVHQVRNIMAPSCTMENGEDLDDSLF